jgi:hypothetical protein
MFGHKFIAAIPITGGIMSIFAGTEYKELDEPICKRCGLTLKQISSIEPVKKG